MPEVVICLEATDQFLKTRIMNLPESVVAGTHNTEEGLLRRLTEYRTLNTEDETVLNYFDEFEIHPEKIGTFVQLQGGTNTLRCSIISFEGKQENLIETWAVRLLKI